MVKFIYLGLHLPSFDPCNMDAAGALKFENDLAERFAREMRRTDKVE